jgi:hypothetical protein
MKSFIWRFVTDQTGAVSFEDGLTIFSLTIGFIAALALMERHRRPALCCHFRYASRVPLSSRGTTYIIILGTGRRFASDLGRSPLPFCVFSYENRTSSGRGGHPPIVKNVLGGRGAGS